MPSSFDIPTQSLAAPGARLALGPAGLDGFLGGGLRRGALHEVFGPAGHEAAATGFALGLACRLGGARPLLWIRQDFSAREFGAPCATGLKDFGIDPARLLLLHAASAEEALRAAGDGLRCGALGGVIIELAGTPKILDLTASRRLVLASAQRQVPALLLRFNAPPEASAAETRWLARAAASARSDEDWGQPVFDVSLIRNRQGRTGQWVVAWSCDDGCFKDQAAAFGAVVCPAGDRQAAAA
ncbi:MAG: DNA repair protein [Alphaproteobacteria bacterium]|nr:DNA repair protein [Alphaproteobacteria bacterium]